MRYFMLACALLLAGCVGKPALDEPSLGGPKLDLETYFDGRVVAYGQFQDVFGEVRRRFEVVIEGDWDGERLRLVETFAYADGSDEVRVWTMRKTGPDSWVGDADGVIGQATGEERGDVFNWRYEIDLPVPDGTLRVTFDDWMWRLDQRRVLNRAYMSKFGVPIGEVIIFFEKE